MNKKNKVLICVSILISFTVWGQKNNYLLKNNGLIPREFLNKGNRSINNLTYERKGNNNEKYAEAFNDENDYRTNRFLNSGIVLYNSVANTYINSVADKLLANNRELRKKLRFYVVRSSEVNAFTFNNGMIFIDIGLLAHLNNEAQLAFIMAHEIAHFNNQHVFENYKQTKEVLADAAKNEDADEDFYKVALSRFSRSQETEADKEGFIIFRESPYNTKNAITVFDVLKYADYPFDNKKIDRKEFEGKYMPLPQKYFPDTASAININEYDADTLSTHPNTGSRKEVMQGLINDTKKEGTDYAVSKALFEDIRIACRFELSNLYIREHDFINSLYNTTILLQEYPNNQYLLGEKIKALYYIQILKNNGSMREVVSSPKKIKGEIQKLHCLFTNATKEEMNAFCLRTAWDCKTSIKDNAETEAFIKAITYNFAAQVSNQLSYFENAANYNEAALLTCYKNDSVSTERKLYAGKKTVRKNRVKLANASFAKFAMAGYLNDSQFTNTFNAEAAKIKINDENAEEDEVEKETKSKQKKKGIKRKKEELNTNHIAIHNLLIIDVRNIHVDTRKKEAVRFRTIQDKQYEMVSLLKMCASLNNINITVFNPEKLENKDTIKFEEKCVLQEWYRERWANSSLPNVLPSNYIQIQNLADKYQTPYVAIISSGTIIEPKKKGEIFLDILLSVLNPPTLPFALYDAFSPNEGSFLRTSVYNLSDGKLIEFTDQNYDRAEKTDLIKAEYYNFFFKLSRNP